MFVPSRRATAKACVSWRLLVLESRCHVLRHGRKTRCTLQVLLMLRWAARQAVKYALLGAGSDVFALDSATMALRLHDVWCVIMWRSMYRIGFSLLRSLACLALDVASGHCDPKIH